MKEAKMTERKWQYCVVGNIKKTHIDKNGVLRYGTSAYTGGTKVYLCGKYWDSACKKIAVIGLNRVSKKFQVNDVDPWLIENVRCKRAYNPAVLELMNNWEFKEDWWGNTVEDKQDTIAFVERWYQE